MKPEVAMTNDTSAKLRHAGEAMERAGREMAADDASMPEISEEVMESTKGFEESMHYANAKDDARGNQ